MPRSLSEVSHGREPEVSASQPHHAHQLPMVAWNAARHSAKRWENIETTKMKMEKQVLYIKYMSRQLNIPRSLCRWSTSSQGGSRMYLLHLPLPLWLIHTGKFWESPVAHLQRNQPSGSMPCGLSYLEVLAPFHNLQAEKKIIKPQEDSYMVSTYWIVKPLQTVSESKTTNNVTENNLIQFKKKLKIHMKTLDRVSTLSKQIHTNTVVIATITTKKRL